MLLKGCAVMSDATRADTPLSVSGVTWELIHGAMYQDNGPLAFIEFFAGALVGGALQRLKTTARALRSILEGGPSAGP